MSLAVQLQSVLSSVTTLEQTLAAQAEQLNALAVRVADLLTENADLLARLGATPGPGPGNTPGGPVPPQPLMQWGFAANETDPIAALKRVLPRVKADGGTWLRLWHSHHGQISPATGGLVDAAVAAGLKVILCVQPKDGTPTPLGTPDFAAFVARNAEVLRRCEFVEAGNELNLVQYRPDDLGGNDSWHGAYVRRWLKPLSAALQAVGVKTMCTSITDTQHPERYAAQYAALLSAGAADWCDAVALHPYVLPQHLQMLATVVGTLRDTWQKPVHITECNVMTRGLTPEQWPARFRPYLATLQAAGVASIAFYRGFPKTAGKWSWPTMFDRDGAPTDCYQTLLDAVNK